MKRVPVALAVFALVLGGSVSVMAGPQPLHAPLSWASSADVVLAQSTRRGSRRGAIGRATASAAREQLKDKRSGPGTDQLFGTAETQSDNFKPFKKWNGAMEKMAEEQADTVAFARKFKDWIKFLDTIRNEDVESQLAKVNSFMNQSKYIQDNKNWGINDYWASPGEFVSKFGDCEDYAIAKYMALKYLGHDTKNMRIVAVKDLNLKVGHAILAYYLDDRIVILDNQIKIVVDSTKVRHYQPVYSINENYWWRHRA